MQPSLVLGRPMLTWWDVKIQGPGLLTGKLHFAIKFEGEVLALSTTEELTLNGPEQRIRVMLPSIDDGFPIDQLQVDITFHGKNFSGGLGQHVLRVPFVTKKVFIGLVGESRIAMKRSPQRDKLMDRLRFEAIVSKSKVYRSADDDREYVKTIFASIDSIDLPSEPLAYCGYDIVVLMGDEFRSLRRPQLDALLAWIKAGGSIYVEPNGILEPFHVEFLRSLVADDQQGIVFQTDSAGKLPRDTVALDRGAVVVECGVGHAVIRIVDPDQEITVSNEEWLTIVKPLWKARLHPVEVATIERQIPGPNGQPIVTNAPNFDPFGLGLTVTNRFRLAQVDLLDRLMPDGVRMVPLSVLALILFAFVVLIGPGDYFVLGWLRMRKLTWLTFPLATIGVTALTVWTSNNYMTSSEARRAAVVRDLSQSGEIVRTNRFESLFIASNRRVTTDVEKGLFVSVNSGFGRGANMSALLGRTPGRPVMSLYGSSLGGNTTDIEGRLPTQFTVTQDVTKWTPQLNRIFSIPGMGVGPQVNWSEFQLATTESNAIRKNEVPKKLIEATKKYFGAKAMVACFSGTDGWAYDRSASWFSTRMQKGEVRQVYNPGIGTFNVITPRAQFEAAFFRWIYDASVAIAEPGLFSIAKQTVPKGGVNCDDLPLLDSSDPEAWMLVVVVPNKDEYVVYRKLMRFVD